jgi:hypothetical protein
MTTPSTTPARLDRVRAWITAILLMGERSVTRRATRASLLVALLATATLAMTGALTAAGGQAAQPPPGPRTYKVTIDLDGRSTPSKGDVAHVDFLRKGQWVSIECQTYGERAYGSRLWDLVTSDGDTLFVPDRFIKTGTNGRASDVRRCDGQDYPPSPFPPTHP